ncbi:CotH kinase family protein [Bacteroidales bacterium OttesenSCG-928-L03]|nr:CotH kinase family protein [Bacteroidales bacterium OttesenSCG-928-L03]
MTRKHNKGILCLVALLFISISSLYAANSKKILINEILASNSTGIQDKDGDRSDWIELYNPGNTTINLSDWSISDSESKPRKWIFPSVSMAPGEYLILFASDKNLTNPTGELHTNFNLSASGEYLGLFEPDGSVSDEYAPEFPSQIADVSYGYYEGELIFFNIPSPGKENTLVGQAQNPKFSVKRGFYNEPFTVSLSVSDPNTKIYYTTNGTRPTNKSTLYTSPIPITTTTPLSAISISGENASQIITHSYFFIQDIIRQTQTPEGYPDRWGVLASGGNTVTYPAYPAGTRAPAHYAMNQAVTNDAAYKSYVEEAFLSLPSVSFVTNPGYFFSDSKDANEGGIYIHTGVNQTSTGRGWERPISMEYYEPSTGEEFQINCGIRIHGAASRQPEKTTKHSFRVSFRKDYGSGKLNYDLFDVKTAVSKFDHLIFRAGFGCSWMHHEAAQREAGLYITDAFLKYLQRDMGHLSAHNRFVHLFINGIYWGIYDISERISNNMMETYFGGEDVDYDIINHDIDKSVSAGGGPADGERKAFDRMVTLATNGDYNTLKAEKLLNMENYIDFVLINVYVGNRDWGNNNWYATRNRVNPDEGFIFYCWDGENSLRSTSDVIISSTWRFKATPLRKILFGKDDGKTNGGLSQNAEFKLLFADRVQKHFFNGGDTHFRPYDRDLRSPSRATQLPHHPGVGSLGQ